MSKGSYSGSAPFGLMQNYNGLHAVVSGKSIVMKKDDLEAHVLCLKYDGNAISSEADGREYSSRETTPSTNTNKVGIGSDDASKYPFFGKIYEVLIFQRLLDECQISTINGYLANKWPALVLSDQHPFNNNSIDICEGGNTFSIDENSINGSSVGTPEVISVSELPVQISGWHIVDQLFDGLFGINSNTGAITIADNTNLDFELATNHILKIEANTNDGLLETEVIITVNDVDDGDAPKQHSLLWGIDGELWNSRGRLPDFSYAGFASANDNIPIFSNQVDVTTYGAVANDEISDVAAIQQAIDEAPDYSMIVIPSGKFIIDAPITIERNNIVIKGVSDEQIGRVVKAIKNSEYADNTLIIVTSDHGYHMGEKEYLFKYSLWEESARIPIIISGLGTPGGTECKQPVSLIDMYPTMVDVCGLPENPNKKGNKKELDGHSLMPLIKNPDNGKWGGNDFAITSIASKEKLKKNEPGKIDQQNYSIRTERYRYILCRNGDEELYDHYYDPYEWNNLTDDPLYIKVKMKLKEKVPYINRK